MNAKQETEDHISPTGDILLPGRHEGVSRTNSFVEFLAENSEVVDEYVMQSRAYRLEDRGWRSSPSLDALTDEFIGTLARSQRLRIDIRRRGELRKRFSTIIFDIDQDSSIQGTQWNNRIHQSKEMFKFLTGQERSEIERISDLIDEMADDYHEAIGPFRESVKTLEREMMSRFYDYLIGGETHIQDVATFLTVQKYLPERERVRPFLVTLADDVNSARKNRRESIIGQGANVWSRMLKESPDRDRLEGFWGVAKDDTAIINSLQFALAVVNKLHPDEPVEIDFVNVDIDTVMAFLPSIQAWPPFMRTAYEQYIDDTFPRPVEQIRVALEQFRQGTSTSLISGGLFQKEEIQVGRKRDKSGRTTGSINPDEQRKAHQERKEGRKPTLVLVQRLGLPTYIATHFLVPIDEGEREEYLNKVAKKYAEGDTRMRVDIENMVDSLLEDPFGLGTKKLVGVKLVIDNHKLHIYRFAPEKRGYSLQLQHHKSKSMRVTYIVLEEDGRTLLGLEDIMTHAEFDEKFAN